MQENMMGHNIIITETSSNLRTLGRNALSGKWKFAILAYILYTLCTSVPTTIFNTFFGTNLNNTQYGYESGMSVDTYSQIYNSAPEYSPISGVYILLVTGAFTLGMTIFFLALFRKQEVGIADIFLGFERFGKALGMLLYQGLFILLWSLIGFAVMALGAILLSFTMVVGIIVLFVGVIVAAVLGAIASIKYSQAFFVMADNPQKSIKDCVNESKIMMKGNKGKYFLLSLSFIGWIILSSIPMGIIIGIASLMSIPNVAVIVLTVVASLFLVPVQVYILSTTTGFYEILAGHLIKDTQPAPIKGETIKEEEKPVLSEPAEKVENNEEPEAPVKEEVDNKEDDIPVSVDDKKDNTFINAKDILKNKDGE